MTLVKDVKHQILGVWVSKQTDAEGLQPAVARVGSHQKQRVTLRDVGQAVGVSAKTVSNVIRGQGWVSEPVRAQVLAAIDELGYRPNLAARQLRSGESGMVALIVPTLKEPYFAELASSFEAAAREHGKTVLVSQTDGHREREIAAIEGNQLPGLDGIVLSPLSLTVQDLEARRSAAPLVLIGEYGELLADEQTVHVGINNVKAARDATQYLLQRGNRRIGVVGFQDDTTQTTSQMRFEGYRQALDEVGVEVNPALIGKVGRFNRAEGAQAVRTLIESGSQFDSLFCFSDSLAFGALHTLATLGEHLGGPVELIGFDNIEEGRFASPAFNTVDVAQEEVSQRVLKILISGDMNPRHIEVPHRVIERT